MIGTFIIRELLQQTSGNDTNIHYLELLYQTEIVRRGRAGASFRVYRTRNYDFSTGCSLRGVVVRVAFSSSSSFFFFFFFSHSVSVKLLFIQQTHTALSKCPWLTENGTLSEHYPKV